MALSKPVVPESLRVIPDIGQHYVECAIEVLVLLQKPKKRKIEPIFKSLESNGKRDKISQREI